MTKARDQRKAQMAAAAARRTEPDARPAGRTAIRSKPVRITLDLSPELYRQLTRWADDAAVDLDVPRVRGTKNPDLAAIRALRPDLVLANQEENRRLDVERLREAGIPVWVTVIQTVDQALASLEKIEPVNARWVLPGHGLPWEGSPQQAVKLARQIAARTSGSTRGRR